MTLFGSKKGYSKNDINFFGEFTASARKQTQVLAVVVFVGVIAIGLCLAILVYDIFRNIGVQKDIDDLNAKLASDEYAGLELASQSLQQEITEMNQYYYTLTEMRRIVDKTGAAKTELVNLIGDSIPSDAFVTDYTVTGETLSMQGITYSYYDAANICYLLNQNNVFAGYVVPSVNIDDSFSTADPEATENPIDIYYDFTISGNLVSDCIISLGHYQTTETGVIALSGVSTERVAAGAEYSFDGINSFSVSGVDYTLSSISINGTPMSAEEFAIASAGADGTGNISGFANGNVEIELYYTVAEVQETSEGGAQ